MNSTPGRLNSPVKREAAERYILRSLVSFALSVIITRTYLQLTGYPQIGNATLHIAHVLWGGLILFIAALLPLILANRWALTVSAILSGVGIGLFIDEVGKFITQNNNYFFPPAAPIIYAFFLLTVLLYLNVRKPASQNPRALMYRVLEDLTEVIDRDLNPDERARIEARLEEIHGATDDPNLHDLADSLERFIDNKQLVVVHPKPGFFERLWQSVFPVVSKVATRQRLKAFLILALGIIGVLAMLDFARMMVAVPSASSAVERLLTAQVLHGQLRSAQEALWFVIRVLLEGLTGIMLIFSGGMIAMGRERSGTQIGTLSLIIWISMINLLVYYFDQFGAVVLTVLQFIVLASLLYYRRAYLKTAV
ncbi:MAG TPA: hypothetical protein VF806_09040 [Anaerolineaceae bacterium]